MDKLTRYLVALLLTSISAAMLSATAPAAVTQSATGSGMLYIQTETAAGLRTFTFTAQKNDDGTTVGEMQLVNRWNDVTVHARIDCLDVVGHTATMSGVITYTNSSFYAMFPAVVFTVADNGEGPGAPPDAISFASFSDQSSADFNCMTAFFPPDQTILAGNVQVRG